MNSRVVFGLVGLLMLPGCGSSNGSGSFVGTASNAAIFIQWTRTADHVTGDLEQALIQNDGGSNGSQSISTNSVAFTGTISGSSVTLTLNQGLGTVTNLAGTMNGDELDLNYPGQNGAITTIQMPHGSPSDYNSAVANLQARVGQANASAQQARAAQQQAQQQAQAAQQAFQQAQGDAQKVGSDLQQLSSDVNLLAGNSFGTDLGAEKKDVAQTETDMQKVLNEAGKTDAGTLCSDAGTVQSDVGTVQGDVGTIQSDQGSVEGNITTVSNDISQLQKDDQALESDRANNPGDVPSSAPGADPVKSAIQSANGAIGQANRAIGSAIGEANSLESTAAGYQSQSDASCRAAGG